MRRDKVRYDEEWCRGADYFRVQEGFDLTSLSKSGKGYHWTSESNAKVILENGLGAERNYLFDHEAPYVYCLLDAPHAKAVDDAGQTDASIDRAFKSQFPEPRIVWFAVNPDYGGDTAFHSEVKLVINLDGAGNWLGKLDTEVWCIPDNAGGYGLYWSGPPIPPKFVFLERIVMGAKDLPPLVETQYGLPQLYLMKSSDQDSYFLALERQKNGAYKGLQVTWYHDKRKPNKAVQASQLVARNRRESGFQSIKLKDVPQAVVDKFDERINAGLGEQTRSSYRAAEAVDLKGAPPEVKEVHAAMVKSAKDGGWEDDLAERAVYTRKRDTGYPDYEKTDDWLVGPNFEGVGETMMYRGGEWYYSGASKPMKGGFDEALSNAELMYHG